jgi:S-disulfanyl-L-cysteine oxidoreductase SoxD
MSSYLKATATFTAAFVVNFSIITIANFVTPIAEAEAQTASKSSVPVIAYMGIGRTATPNEVAAWDIDVRPDFKGIPKGAGSVSQGEKLWEAQCASCHGSFGENNQVFTALVGYTTKNDSATGRVASLNLNTDTPTRTSLMKVSQVSTLWDYINRAMPWTAPKSLQADEVYALTAYLLNLGNALPDNFVLSDKNIADVQKKLPNRNGVTTRHAMWPGTEFEGTAKSSKPNKPDTQGDSCMSGCKNEPTVASSLPAYAMNAHGNLAEQNRIFGGVRGLDTTQIAAATTPSTVATHHTVAHEAKAIPQSVNVPVKPAQSAPANTVNPTNARIKTTDIMPMLNKNACTACHAVATKVMGPAFKDVSKKYAGRSDGRDYLTGKIKSGGGGIWGAIPMPPSATPEAEARKIAEWLMQSSLD